MVDIMACFVDDVMWGGTDDFNSVIETLGRPSTLVPKITKSL